MYPNDYEVVHAYYVPLEFPEGLMVGAAQGSIFLKLERQGDGRPVLRGSSIAGLLRHYLAEQRHVEAERLDEYFGWALDEWSDRGTSPLVFYDVPFANSCLVCMHNQMDRQWGVVDTTQGGLFAIERVAPGARSGLLFCLQGFAENAAEDQVILGALEEAFASGLVFGGNGNRGLGRALVRDNTVRYERFDLRDAASAAAYLDFLYGYVPGQEVCWGEKRVLPKPFTGEGCPLHLEVTFTIPRGQDFLIGDGRSMVPQKAEVGPGQGDRWKIPGSSLRGIMRSWMERLAARGRSGEQAKEGAPDGDWIGSLFGTLSNKGRIHISDAYSQRVAREEHMQRRQHVVIDRFSGGNMLSGLFENYVLTSAANLRFTTTIRIVGPHEHELQMLAEALTAIDRGVVRVGSSKAAGRLQIVDWKVLSGSPEPFARLPKGGR